MDIKSLILKFLTTFSILSGSILAFSVYAISKNAQRNQNQIANQYLKSTYEIYKNDLVGLVIIQDFSALNSLIKEIEKKRDVVISIKTNNYSVNTESILRGDPLIIPISSGVENLGNVYLAIKGVSSFWSTNFEIIWIFLIQLIIFGIGYYVLFKQIQSRLAYPILSLTKAKDSGYLESFQVSNNAVIEIKNLASSLKNLYYELNKQAKEHITAELTKQVAHDIRSPLAALNMITQSLQDVPEEKRLMIRNSIQRINDISNDLLNRGKRASSVIEDNYVDNEKKISNLRKTTEVILLPALIDSLVSEKRIQYRDQIQVQIQSDLKNSFGDFVLADGKELMRVLSNLINNSVEAFDNKGGEVTVSIEKNTQPASDQSSNRPSSQSEAEACKSMILITIKDNGKGIPVNVLEKLGDVGVSFGKEGSQSGSGIGIYHAKKTIEEFGGKFKIISQVGVGTEVQIYLPKTKSPVWFLESLTIPNHSLVISLDDDISIHQIWKGRLASLNASAHQVQLQSFTSAEEFKKFVLFKTNFSSDAKNTTQSNLNTRDVASANQFYLIDYELLGQNTNGLKIIEELGLQNNVTLVTSRYEEPQIQQKCEQLGIKLLPKQLAGFVPMELEEIMSTTDQQKFNISVNSEPQAIGALAKYDWILIDDDPLVHMTWQFISKERQKTFLGFKSYKEFSDSKDNIDPTSNFYIDSNLGDGIKGEVIAKQMHSEGYQNLFIATGYDPDHFKNLDYITDVIGKEPPMS